MVFNKEEWRIPTPFGRIGWINLMVTAFALLLFLVSAFRCFLTVDKTDEYKVFIGYWGAEDVAMATQAGRGNDNNYCVSWSKESRKDLFDGAWKFGRTIGIVGAVISIPLMILAVYIMVFKVDTKVFTLALGANIMMSITSILLLVGLSSDVCKFNNCRMGPGGYFAILDFFLWCIAALIASRIRASTLDERVEEEKDISNETAIVESKLSQNV